MALIQRFIVRCPSAGPDTRHVAKRTAERERDQLVAAGHDARLIAVLVSLPAGPWR